MSRRGSSQCLRRCWCLECRRRRPRTSTRPSTSGSRSLTIPIRSRPTTRTSSTSSRFKTSPGTTSRTPSRSCSTFRTTSRFPRFRATVTSPLGDKLVCNMGTDRTRGRQIPEHPRQASPERPDQFPRDRESRLTRPTRSPGTTPTSRRLRSPALRPRAGRFRLSRFGHGTVRGHGISCGVDFNPGLDCTEPFSEGGTATLRANDKINFVGWGGDCAFAGTNTICSLPVTGNMDVQAHFVDNPIQPPVAQFETTSSGPKKPGMQIFFNSSGVQNATAVSWKVDSPGPGPGLGFTTPPTSTYTGLRLNEPGTYNVTQTATGPAGSSSFNQNIIVSGNTNFLGKHPPNVAFSAGSADHIAPGPLSSRNVRHRRSGRRRARRGARLLLPRSAAAESA